MRLGLSSAAVIALACAASAAPLVRLELPEAPVRAPFTAAPSVLAPLPAAPGLGFLLAPIAPSLSPSLLPAVAPAPTAEPTPLSPAAAEAPPPQAAPAAAEQGRSALVTLVMPSGRTIQVARAFQDDQGLFRSEAEGPDGILIELGRSESSFGVRAEDFAELPSDWALIAHDGRITRVRERRGVGRPGLVGGAARSVLIVDGGRARALGLAPGRTLAALGEGSSVIDVERALLSGGYSPADLARNLSGNAKSEPRHFLDSLIARLDDDARAPGEEGRRAAALREATLEAVARCAAVDGHLRMQAATRLFLDGMPLRLLRFDKKWPKRAAIAYRYADLWIHETGHQVASALVGVPVMEKRVFAHAAGFIVNVPGATKPRRVAIDLAGAGAEISVGLASAGLGAALALSASGLWLAAAALPAAALVVLGLRLVLTAPAHACSDLAHLFGVLGWKKAKSFVEEAIAESIRLSAAENRGATAPAHVFYRAFIRVLFRRAKSSAGPRFPPPAGNP